MGIETWQIPLLRLYTFGGIPSIACKFSLPQVAVASYTRWEDTASPFTGGARVYPIANYRLSYQVRPMFGGLGRVPKFVSRCAPETVVRISSYQVL